MGVRDYHPEDDFRRMHWPATAHTGQLQVKVYQPASAQVMMVCLNVSTLAHYWEGILPELLEHLVRVTASIVQQGLQDGYRVGLVSNGCLAHADQPFRVPPGRSPDQLAHLLSTLAGVTPLVTGSFDRFLIFRGTAPALWSDAGSHHRADVAYTGRNIAAAKAAQPAYHPPGLFTGCSSSYPGRECGAFTLHKIEIFW